MAIIIAQYNVETVKKFMLEEETDFIIDSTATVNIKVPLKALNILLKQDMAVEDVTAVLSGKPVAESKEGEKPVAESKEGEKPAEKTPLKCALAIAPGHEKIIGDYFRVVATDKEYAWLQLSIQDERGGFNKFTKEQLKFLLDITGGELTAVPVPKSGPEPELGSEPDTI